jgi:hypothetical protein
MSALHFHRDGCTNAHDKFFQNDMLIGTKKNMPQPEAQQLKPTTAASLQALPIYIFGIGAAMIAAILGADLIGLSRLLGDDGALKDQMMRIGAALAALGALADFAAGRRLLTWLKAIIFDWRGLVKFSGLVVQLGLLVTIVQMSSLEHNAFFYKLMPLTFYGFIIHYFLPRDYRLAFFLLLSFAAIFGVLGLVDGAWLIGLSLGLIGLAHLPISFAARGFILLAVAVMLVVMRAGYLPFPWPQSIWPILASMFMFRMVIYFYDLKHKKVPAGGLTHTLSYFFLLPNVAFPLFPAVDYSTYRRTYYDEDEHRIYQTGMKWIFWAAVHLLIYRYIDYYWVIPAEKVNDTASLVQYLTANYLLIIRLSGLFHMSVGILHLFGFNLPRIMDLYLLASGFTDYWRRVNVYWKEFIQKVFYYPAYFRMRKMGNWTKLVVATIVGFLMTWFFHSYQWFWMRGAFLLSLPDAIFWSSMGALVLANSLYEAKYGRKRILTKRTASLGEIGLRALRASGIFVVMAMIWSIWVSPSVSAWFALLAGAEINPIGIIAALAILFATLGAAMFIYEKWAGNVAAVKETQPNFLRLALPTAGAILLLYFLVQPEYYHRLGGQAVDLITDLRSNRLNAQDAALLERGYYENLSSANNFNLQLWELYTQKPDDWLPLIETEAARLTGDFMKYELAPLVNIYHKNAPFHTNRWGMRDDDYEQLPAPGTYRIAMIGGSITQGSGVRHEETFEYLLEKRLNREHAGKKYAQYEVLNFAVGGYNIFQSLMALEKKVLAFKPHAVFCVAHVRDEARAFGHLVSMLSETIPYEGLREIMNRAGVIEGIRPSAANKRLEPYINEILLWAYSRVVETCRQQGVLPVWICLPSEPGEKAFKKTAVLIRIAEQAGFIVLNLTDVYDGHPGPSLQVSAWDKHPNAIGHRLIAQRLYQALRGHQEIIPLGVPASAQAALGAKSE